MRAPNPRALFSLPAAVLLGIGIHVDWHLARHHGRLSAAWPWHWALALPLFAVAAWYVARRWPDATGRVSVGTIAAGVLLGQVLEPIGELVFYGWSLGESFGPERLGAFTWFVGAGLATYLAMLLALSRRRTRRERSPVARGERSATGVAGPDRDKRSER